jgi:hypothetical protein
MHIVLMVGLLLVSHGVAAVLGMMYRNRVLLVLKAENESLRKAATRAADRLYM